MRMLGGLEMKEISAALAELDGISRDEYHGLSLEELLLDPGEVSALRLQRITGIALKRPFAKRAEAPPYSRTGAKWSWPWTPDSPVAQASVAPREFEILCQLRMPGSWNERKQLRGDAGDLVPIEWDDFKSDVEHERGLFKILALYVDDVLKLREGRSIREYLEADESPAFEGGLDLATVIFDAAVTTPISAVLGIPSVAVGVALVVLQYGYRRATDTNKERLPDQLG